MPDELPLPAAEAGAPGCPSAALTASATVGPPKKPDSVLAPAPIMPSGPNAPMATLAAKFAAVLLTVSVLSGVGVSIVASEVAAGCPVAG